MSLQDKRHAIRAAAKTRIPPEAQAVMQRAVEDVRASGILARAPKPGEPPPDFTLANQAGQSASLEALRACGPVVLSFYRCSTRSSRSSTTG